MTSHEFVNALQDVAPTRDDFKKYNLPADYVGRVLKGYHCSKKQRDGISPDFENDALLELLSTYDCSSVQIGLISLKDPISFDDYYEIGNVEMDLLVLNRVSNEIEVRDHDSPETTMWLCAKSSEHFLEALLILAKYFTSKIKNPSISDDEDFRLETIELLATESGGEKFTEFYEMLLS